jgi:uncharacterized tellurite resistance protein B-like protein
MGPKESLYYALGELAYAVASSDGEVQKEESQKLHDIIAKEAKCANKSIDVAAIIFHVLQKDKVDTLTTYSWAIKQMKLYSHYLTDDMKVDFVGVLEKVAHAFNSVTIEEEDIIKKIRNELKNI